VEDNEGGSRSAYGPKRAEIQESPRNNKVAGWATADSNTSAEIGFQGNPPAEENPNIIERSWGSIPVRPSPDCLNGNDVKGYVTVKAGMRPNFNDPNKLSEK